METRQIQHRAVHAEDVGFPFAAQLALIRRHRFYVHDGHEETGFTYVLTSREPSAASPADLLAFSRDHWGIETRVHYTRDANYHEDRCRIRQPTTLHVCASLRTLASWLLGKRMDGSRRNTRRRQYRRLARHPGQAVRLVMRPVP